MRLAPTTLTTPTRRRAPTSGCCATCGRRWERRLRIMLDWTVALLFKNDIVKLDLFGEEHPVRRAIAARIAVRAKGETTEAQPAHSPQEVKPVEIG